MSLILFSNVCFNFYLNSQSGKNVSQTSSFETKIQILREKRFTTSQNMKKKLQNLRK